jgi:ATP-dependent metalloprotease
MLLQSDQAFQLYLTALVQSGLSSSVHHAVQRRDALLRDHSPSSSIESVNTESALPHTDTLVTPSQPLTAPSASVAPSAPLTSSQAIAQQVLATASSPVASQALGTTFASSLNPNQQLAALVGAGGGGANSPVHVVLSERESLVSYTSATLFDPMY